MTKTDLIFPAFSSRFAVSFHSTRSDARDRFDSGVIFLDQSQFFAMHSNLWNCFILKSRHNQMAFFRAKAGQRQGKRPAFALCWNLLKSFRYYIKQIDSMLPCVWFSNRSQKTSKCGKNISDKLGYASCATFLFLSHFDVICDLLLNRRTATWNLFVN